MEKISKLISKKVISLDDAKEVGYVLDVILDENVKTYTGLIVVDEESENSFVLPRENIYSVGDDTIMIENSSKLQFNISDKTNNPIGKLVYDSHGNGLGRVIDVEFQGKTVRKIITTFCEFPQRYIRKSGDNFIIFGAKKRRKTGKEFNVEVIQNFSSLPKVTIASPFIGGSNVVSPEAPVRLYASTKMLIGKIVTNDILGYNNEIIARKNEEITQKIINKAKAHNKFNLLSYYSK